MPTNKNTDLNFYRENNQQVDILTQSRHFILTHSQLIFTLIRSYCMMIREPI